MRYGSLWHLHAGTYPSKGIPPCITSKRLEIAVVAAWVIFCTSWNHVSVNHASRNHASGNHVNAGNHTRAGKNREKICGKILVVFYHLPNHTNRYLKLNLHKNWSPTFLFLSTLPWHFKVTGRFCQIISPVLSREQLYHLFLLEKLKLLRRERHRKILLATWAQNFSLKILVGS